MDYFSRSLEVHKEHRGKLEIASKVPLETLDDLSISYTPGVAEPCRLLAKDPAAAYDYTIKGNLVAVVTDGSAVLGLGNIGGLAGLPVMEGKALLFKHFADVDAFPICLATQEVDEIVATVKAIAPTFGGINLEDISAPRCFEVEKRLREELDIPVFHDDQHGTAIVTLAGLLNALKVVNKKIKDIRIVVNGAGAAGIAVSKLLIKAGVSDLVMCDSKGVIYEGRENLDPYKEKMAAITNPRGVKGDLAEAMKDADVFIGVSVPECVTAEMVSSMADKAIVFAMSNPTPEIMPNEAQKGGALVMATGRSDLPNQINNALVFPGIFRGLLDGRATAINPEMLLKSAHALAVLVADPKADKIIPQISEKGVSEAVAEAVKSCC
ncbi:NAD-dependent malic enzyme [Candidatus Peregrinibacteria bacterium]|jgi:malate dehydrogenase (oxaloacetate-decarboxylating)|nr:NAD-dependent malic enzyme [Candidatus Peregrinibacteria bacterium]MBT7703395.1 NAD-dependent malic enzyme [Candidatus Peregrinibacteria bacterium]